MSSTTALAPRIIRLPSRAVVTAFALTTLKWVLFAYCVVGVLGYAPPTDARGNCSCPFCDPFSLNSPIPRRS